MTARSFKLPISFHYLRILIIHFRPQEALLQPLLHNIPVDHIPHRTKVLGLSVLILQIVCMLPSINTQQWSILAHDGILVGICANLDLSRLVVLDQPCPPAALNAREGRVEFSLEGSEIAVGGFDCGLFYPLMICPSSYNSSHCPSISQEAVIGMARRTFTAPVGSPPPPFLLGAKFSQNKVWLM